MTQELKKLHSGRNMAVKKKTVSAIPASHPQDPNENMHKQKTKQTKSIFKRALTAVTITEINTFYVLLVQFSCRDA